MKHDYPHFLYIILLLAFLSFANTAFPDPSDSFLSDDINFEEIFTDLPQKCNIEDASLLEISNLPYFEIESARNVVNFRDSLKTVTSFRENLENIPELSPIQYAILNYLSYEGKSPVFNDFSGSFRNGFMYHPEEKKLSDGKYYFKINIENEKQIKFTTIGERDPFEPRALDLFSTNLSIKLKKARTHIIIGDYRPECGQNLIFSRYSRSYMNGTDVMVNKPKIVANSLFEETLYLRGVYLKFQKGRITTELWSSFRKIDATIDESGKALNIINTGYHYSGTGRENLKETINAARVVFNELHDLKFGITGVITSYSPALARHTSERYINYPEGSQYNYVSFDGELTKGPAVLFFEHVESVKNENATIGGLQIKNKKVRTSVLLRNYSEGYWAPRSSSFSSFGKTTNERGIYSALQAELPYASRVVVSMDIARSLSRTYSETMPISRRRLNLMLQSKFNSNLIGRFIARSVGDSGDEGKRWSCRILLERKQKSKNILGWKSTIAWSESDGDGGPYTEIAVFSNWHKLKVHFSTGFFDIPSYKSRFYRYEYDVPGRGFTRAVWGKGGTVLIMCSWGSLSVRYRFVDSSLCNKSSEFTLQSDLIF